MRTLVSDVMTTRVIWVREDAPFRELAAALRMHRVSAFPVLSAADTVVGVVSEADMLTKEALDPEGLTALLHHRDAVKARGVTAGDLMTSPAVTIGPRDDVRQAARLMYTRKVKRLPVTDRAGHLLGIVSRADVLSVFDRPDRDLRREILDEVIVADCLADPKDFTVTVSGGVVTLAGTPETAEAGHQIVQRARHVQGVVAVRDRLSYPHEEGP